ncbi:MAG: hypothetical protein KF706_06440 [Chitinophagales bacterium]|nr:hypothetical protein [Chitinophagales bacterium]
MQTGITLTGNQDLSYMGLRQVGEKEDITETTIAWADDGGGELGPDDLVFRFLGGGPGASSVSSDFTDPSDLDGVNIARFTPFGQIGFGNTFGLTADHPNYVRPQNLLHLSTASDKQVYLQITNQSATGQTATDGLHIGYAASNLEAQIIQKENANLTLFTNNTPRFTIAGGGNVGVNTNTPAYTLQVNGSFSAKQVLVEDKDLLLLISDLQSQINELKHQLALK